MSLFDCIGRAMDDPDIGMDRTRGEKAQALFNELYAKYRAGMGDDLAARQAAADTKKILRQRNDVKRRNVAKDISDQRRLSENVLTHKNRKGEFDPGEALVQLVTNTDSAKFLDVNNASKAIHRQLIRGLEGFFDRHKKNILGETRDKILLAKVQRELFGEATGDATAQSFAKALRDSFEQARLMFNDNGGHIQKLENWAPQIWRRQAFRVGGAEEFADDLIDRVDWEKMIDPVTGRPFGAGNASREFLIASFESIRTDGLNRIKPTMGRAGKALANQRAEQRQLIFKSSDDWTAVAEKYGSPNLFDATIGYIDLMARDIAQLKHLGRNPAAALEYAIQVAQKQASTMPQGAIDRVNQKAGLARKVLHNYTGSLSVAENEFWANFWSGTRNVLSSAYLGSAILSSVTDNVTLANASRHLGLPARQVLSQHFKGLIAGATKRDLQNMIGTLETAMETSAAMTKYMGEAVGPELTRRMASFVIRVQGLAHWTDIGRATFQSNVMQQLATDSGRAFGDLHPSLRRSMELSGITEADWNVIRATETFKMESGGEAIVPFDLIQRTDLDPEYRQNLFEKYQGMLERETEYAIPSRDLVGESVVLNNQARGTLGGEFARGGLQFKGFAISQLMGTIRRTRSIDGVAGRIQYLAILVSGLTLMGALSIQLNNVVKGKDMDDMDSVEFWARALIKGGGLGIMGDFLASETNRFGGGVAETVLGPQVGLASSVTDLTFGNLVQLYQGKDTKFRKEATDMIKRHVPGANLWQARLVMERLVWDQLQLMIDPEAPKYLREKERKSAKETGAEYWYDPGELLPDF